MMYALLFFLLRQYFIGEVALVFSYGDHEKMRADFLFAKDFSGEGE